MNRFFSCIIFREGVKKRLGNGNSARVGGTRGGWWGRGGVPNASCGTNVTTSWVGEWSLWWRRRVCCFVGVSWWERSSTVIGGPKCASCVWVCDFVIWEKQTPVVMVVVVHFQVWRCGLLAICVPVGSMPLLVCFVSGGQQMVHGIASCGQIYPFATPEASWLFGELQPRCPEAKQGRGGMRLSVGGAMISPFPCFW